MRQTQWTMPEIKQCELEMEQAMLSNEHSLFFYTQDFGHLQKAHPVAACIPETPEALQALLRFAHTHERPMTIRGNGLSQGGQSLPVDGGITVHMQAFHQVQSVTEDVVWVEANTTFADILARTLSEQKVPYVVPYNCGLSVGGVISAGGMGAASFRYGNVAAHVKALDVFTVSGEKRVLDKNDELFHACLAGQGQFAVIHRVALQLRPCKPWARTFYLLYTDSHTWLNDLQKAALHADAIEAFCTPAIQGTKTVNGRRIPFAQWFYALHVTLEYDDKPPEFEAHFDALSPWKRVHQHDETIADYYHRHDSRFVAMKQTGQWEQAHPWFECFLPESVLRDTLEESLAKLPIHYANVLHVVPVDRKADCGFFMLPEKENVFELMVLSPGVQEAALPECLTVVAELEQHFLARGGKRYLSGYLGKKRTDEDWKQHYGHKYERWLRLKSEHDPKGLLSSKLYMR